MCKYVVYDRLFGEIPPISTVHAPYTWFCPTLTIFDVCFPVKKFTAFKQVKPWKVLSFLLERDAPNTRSCVASESVCLACFTSACASDASLFKTNFEPFRLHIIHGMCLGGISLETQALVSLCFFHRFYCSGSLLYVKPNMQTGS